MTASLPLHPTLEALRKEAKALRKRHSRGESAVCSALRRIPRFAGASDDRIMTADVGLQECQCALARDYGFGTWGDLKRHVLARTDPSRMLHVFWGDILADALRETTTPGETMVWRDMGAYAPTPADDAALVTMHAEILVEEGFFETVEAALQARTDMEERLAAFRNHAEVVLWFDTCLYDHVILVRHLDWFAKQDLGETVLSLVCVERPLAEHRPEELAALLEERRPISRSQLELGSRAWHAYRSPDPTALEQLLDGDTSPLPYLRAAFTDHLQRFPSVRNGLCSIDALILKRSIELGRVSLTRLIGACLGSGLTYLSDTLTATHMRMMVECRHPLLKVHGQTETAWRHPYGEGDAEITPVGEAVLAGKEDFVKLNGIDRWLGGVHLHGPDAQWRWCNDTHGLVPGDMGT